MVWRQTIALVTLVFVVGLVAPRTATAGFVNEPEESPKWFTTGLTVSWWFPAEGNTSYTRVYDSAGKAIWRLHFGVVPIARYVQLEIGVSVGFAQHNGHQVGASSDDVSGENVMMTLTPLRWGFRLGIDPLEEFPVVPFAQIGWDYILWKEHASSEELTGGKGAWHYGFGLAFLLDRLEPLRAGRNDAAGGLNDAFLVVDGTRVQYLPPWQSDSALDLSGWQLTVGLKLDF